MQRIFSMVGEVLAPTYHSALDDLKNHWRSIKTFYIEKHDTIESFHEFQLPGHIISMVSILIEESKSTGEAGPCLEYFLKNRILETLCLLGVHDSPNGVRKLVLQTITILLSDLSLPLLPHMSVHKPIYESFGQGESFIVFQGLLKNLWTVGSIGERARKAMIQCLELIPETNPAGPIIGGSRKNSLSEPNSNSTIYPNINLTEQFKQLQNSNIAGGGGNFKTNDSSLSSSTSSLSSLSVSPTADLIPSLTSPPPPTTSTTTMAPPPPPVPSSMTPPTSGVSMDKVTTPITTPIKSSYMSQQIPSTPLPNIQSPTTRKLMFETPAKDVPVDHDKLDVVFSDPLVLLNHVMFINNMISELIKTYNLLPLTISSVNYCISGPPIAHEHLSILECYKSRVSFICSLSSLKHNNIGEYITKLWEESFISDTLGPALLHIDDSRCATAMLYLREILPILQGNIVQKTITFLVGDTTKPETRPSEDQDDYDGDECIMKKTLISRMSHQNFIVSISSLRLFSTLLGLHNFSVLYNLILVNLPQYSNFSYLHNGSELEIAHRSITQYLSLFGNKYCRFASNIDSNLSEILHNKVSSQTNGYSAYLVDARYQISLYSQICSNWPSNYLFNNNNINNSNSNNISSPVHNNNHHQKTSIIISSPTTNNKNQQQQQQTTSENQDLYMGSFLEQLFKLFKQSLTLPIDINFVITGIFSKLCYYPCPQIYPSLIHCADDDSSPFPNLYSIIKDLSIEIENRSINIPLFIDILDQLRLHMTDIGNITNRDPSNQQPVNRLIQGLDQPTIDFLNSVIILEEFCKELASIVQARVIKEMNSNKVTFITIFRMVYLRDCIFQSFSQFPIVKDKRYQYTKGKEIVSSNPFKSLIHIYALPWEFIKHYLPPIETIHKNSIVFSLYCRHRNATLSTLVHILDWLPEGYIDIYSAMTGAASVGQFDIIKMLHNRYSHDSEMNAKAAIDNATRIGHYEIVEFLLANQYQGHDAVTVEIAARLGHVPLLKILTNDGTEWVRDLAFFSVCESGNVEAVKYLDQFRPQYLDKYVQKLSSVQGCQELFTTHEFICAITKGQSLDVVKYLHENRTEKLKDGYQLMNNACKDDSLLEILKFLHFNRTEGCTEQGLKIAAELGQLEIVKFLVSHYPELKVESAYDFATRHHHNNVVKFLYLNTTDNATIALTQSIIRLNLEMAIYLLENHTDKVQLTKTQWDILNLNNSEKWDHVKQLFEPLMVYLRDSIFQSFSQFPIAQERRYLFKKGKDIQFKSMIQTYALPWEFIKHYLPPLESLSNGSVLVSLYCRHRNATLSTLVHLLDWLPSIWINGPSVFSAAAAGGHLDIIKMLHNRYTSGKNICAKAAIENATGIGHFEIVEFLLANQYQGHGTSTVEIAAKLGHVPLLKLLTNDGTEWVRDLAFFSVCESGNVEALKYLDQFRQQYLNKMDPSYYHSAFTTHEFLYAISIGQSLDVVKYLHANRTEKLKDGYQLMNNACKDDSLLEILKFLHFNRTEGCTEHGLEIFLVSHYPELKAESAYHSATRYLQNDVVKFLYLNTTDNATIALTIAITLKNLEIAKYLLENHTDKVQLQSAHWERLNLIENEEWDHVKHLFQSLYNNIQLK
ncbi:hypothetical protein DFA_07880 [Cavenderia fasciculata]|uniref:FHF complex subunit HOOK-interacting protein C-terminal domain-containing protein n=1 Tax=Cavenderia fasciculata TaxID=261658 RepID=F4Q3T3_CACFS|nr:uncharacterized protein DFA_07880 [Cavenderia fasciculata]EGG16899.1 hypothetical protein DFA_07880 [Cavenderia fasciculata]|eukprot:XP_004355373.1 hypothetical protein DFA_07880 [Cavenderia fasciculata]